MFAPAIPKSAQRLSPSHLQGHWSDISFMRKAIFCQEDTILMALRIKEKSDQHFEALMTSKYKDFFVRSATHYFTNSK